ncbi:MAG: DMT family transporter [Anaerolineae bacterium]|nr:DMT family transporter [Anaerolineae bacterium]
MALGTATCWAFTSLLFSYSGRRVGSRVVNTSRLLFAVLILASVHWLVYGTLLPLNVEPFRWGWFTLSSLLGLVVGDGLLFQAFVLIGRRLSAFMMALVPIFSTLLAWLLFGETVTPLELTGIVLTLTGIGWVVTERRSPQAVVENKQYGWGILLGVGAALGQATGLITARFGLADNFPAFSATLIRMLVAALMMWGLAAGQGKIGLITNGWRNRPALTAIVGGTIVGPVLGVWLSLAAIQIARLGIAATLMALTPIILIPLTYFILKEKISERSIVGTVVALSGVALIFL